MTPEQVFLALGLAWQTLTGSTPDRRIIHILHAQSALETGHWKAIMNYNLGGAKKHGDHDWCYFTTTERLPHKTADQLIASSKPGDVTVLKQDEQFKTVKVSGKQSMNCFASWEDLDSAAKAHLELLFRRFPTAIDRAKAGDAAGYVHELKRRGYFTASEEEYSKTVNSIVRRYEKDLANVALPTVIVL